MKNAAAQIASFLLLAIVPAALPAAEAPPLAAARAYVAQNEETKADFLEGAKIADVLEAEPGIEAQLWRLRVIARALLAVDYENREQPAIAAWLAKHDREVIFSEPSGQYYVSRQLVWQLHDQAKTAPGGAALVEEIAWDAARTPAGGECEGYLNCQLADSLDSIGRYLELYPKGKYKAAALDELFWVEEEGSEVPPLDRQDVPEAKRLLTRWHKILGAVEGGERYRRAFDKQAVAYQVK